MKRIRVDAAFVPADKKGRVATWELSPDHCPILTFVGGAGELVIAAVDGKGRSYCRESEAYELMALHSSSASPHDTEPPRSTVKREGSRSPPVERKKRPPTKYNQFMKMYMAVEGHMGFKEGATIWSSFSKEDKKNIPVTDLMKRATAA